jgi:hypothetical protein
VKRIQIQLTDRRLDDVVNEMATESTVAVDRIVKLGDARGETRAAVRQAIRGVLEKYVHAYDLCGLSILCNEATEIDPWELKDQDKD